MIKNIFSKKPIIWIIVGIALLIVAVLAVIFFYVGMLKEAATVADIPDENPIVEEPTGEIVDIEELEIILEPEEPEEQPTQLPEPAPEKNEEQKVTTNNSTPYYIKVNYGAQVVTIYSKDKQGNYTVPVKAMVCSTGTYTPTSGVYSIPARWNWLALKGNVYGQYATQITGNILFHSVPYLRKGDPASLEYWEYDKLGTRASLGCIRLTVQDAKWIFDNCARGTKVEFYSNTNPGPLGKPSAKKISSYADYLRNWDPTDPKSNNPWKTYKEAEVAKTNTVAENKVVNQTTTENKVVNQTENKTNQQTNQTNNQVNHQVTNQTTTNRLTNATNESKNTIGNNTTSNLTPNNTANQNTVANTVKNEVANKVVNQVNNTTNNVIGGNS